MADDSTQFQEPTSADILGLVGSLFGGRSPLGRLASAGAGFIDKGAREKFEQANRPRILQGYVNEGVLTPDDVNRMLGYSSDEFLAIQPKLDEAVLRKRAQKTALPKLLTHGEVFMQNGVPGQLETTGDQTVFKAFPKGTALPEQANKQSVEQQEFDAFKKAYPNATALDWFNYKMAQAAALKQKLAEQAPAQKFENTPIGALTGRTMLTPGGKPWPDPRMTVGEAARRGGILLTDKDADQFASSIAAEKNLDTLLQAGGMVLPKKVPTGIGETARDIAINPAKRYILAKVDPRYAGYEHAKAGIISYVRELARAGRINNSELNLIVSRLNNAQTFPALKSAVDTARQIMRQDRATLVRAGRLSESSEPPIIGYTPDGTPIYGAPNP